MTAENDFLPFAAGAGSNVLTQAQYAALAAVSTGFAAGTASSAGANKAWRQSSIIAAVIADFIVAYSGQPAIDDGTTATLLANFGLALQAFACASSYAPDTGAPNALVATISPTPFITAGLTIRILVAHTNTGTTTINVNGGGATAIDNPDGTALSAGQLTASGMATLTYNGVLWELQSITGAPAIPVIGDARNAQMNVTAASYTATFIADEIVVGSALGGATHKIGSFNQGINLATIGVGGLDNGTTPASGYVALYAIYNPTTGVSALLAANATTSIAPTVYGGGHMPAGYTMSALISVWPTNGSSQFVVGLQRGRRINFTSMQALTTSSVTSVTALSIASIVPPNATRVGGTMSSICTSVGIAILNIFASGASIGLQVVVAGQAASEGVDSNYAVDLSTQQSIYYSATNTNGTPTFTINVSSYEF